MNVQILTNYAQTETQQFKNPHAGFADPSLRWASFKPALGSLQLVTLPTLAHGADRHVARVASRGVSLPHHASEILGVRQHGNSSLSTVASP